HKSATQRKPHAYSIAGLQKIIFLIRIFPHLSFKLNFMASYSDLETYRYYLIKEKDSEDLEMVQAVMKTKKCVLLKYFDAPGNLVWKKKSALIEEITEELTGEQAHEYLELLSPDDDDFFMDDDDDDTTLRAALSEFDDEDEYEDEDDDDNEQPNKSNGNNLRPVK
ncbi:MAG TPA: hypothetical protein PL045_10125, partial [Chitinophagaceae bacterium]|nr:hypothetical protein [Chitinophagaceae bacterium]